MKNLLIFFFVALQGGLGFAQTSNPQQYKYIFTVAKDGSGDYKFIQDAIDAMRVYPLAPITLYIKNGVYNEKIELPENNTDVMFIGRAWKKPSSVLMIIPEEENSQPLHPSQQKYRATVLLRII
jgi:pectinesterase